MYGDQSDANCLIIVGSIETIINSQYPKSRSDAIGSTNRYIAIRSTFAGELGEQKYIKR
jgi:hypothetical protein